VSVSFYIYVEIAICVAIIFATLASMWRRGYLSIGLPLSYLLSLSVIHLVGGFIHTLPWHRNDESYYADLGFQQYFYGMLAFAAGSLVLAPMVLSHFRPAASLHSEGGKSNPRLPLIYIVSGLACFTVLAPVLGRIPSFGAVTFCGVYLIVVGFCLGCWKAFQEGNKPKTLLWLSLVGSLPVLTTLTMGFLGYGALAAMMVCIFLTSFFRPRWLTLVGVFLMFYLGLSAYVTYMRDRSALREVIWGEESHAQRLAGLAETIRSFEWIDFEDERHLSVIDERINQNAIVGRAVDNLSSGGVPYARE
jgi:hypothetical protein